MASGENGQGIAIKMINNATANQIVIVLYFSRSVSCLLDKEEPMVIKITEIVIKAMWINPKNKKSICCKACLVLAVKYLTVGLWK